MKTIRIIKVTSCYDCPITDDVGACEKVHDYIDGGKYENSFHPDCPLEEQQIEEQVNPDEPDTSPIVALNPKPNLRFGINGSFFTVPLSVKLKEKDRFTIESINFDISVMEEGQESEKQEGVFLHKVRLVTSSPNDFIQSDNIKKGMKIVVL